METLSGHHGITWLLTNIQDGTITSTSDMVAHGNIQKWQGGLKLDGKTAWIEGRTTQGIKMFIFYVSLFVSFILRRNIAKKS